MTRGPRFVLSTVLVMTLGLSLLIGVIHFGARGKGPAETRAKIVALEQTCQNTYASRSEQGDVYGLPQSNYSVCPPSRIGDLVMAFGEPSGVSCLNYSLNNKEHVVWIRFQFAANHIEALVMLPGDAQRLMPDDPVETLVFYDTEDDFFVANMSPWRGFTVLDAYQTCNQQTTETHLYSGTQGRSPARIPICSCS